MLSRCRIVAPPVRSQRSDQALGSVARRTGGILVPLGLASVDLGPLYQTKIEPAARRRREASRLAERAEGFPLVLIAALVFLLASCWPYGRGWGWTWHWSWRWQRPVKNLNPVRAAFVIAMAGMLSGAGDVPSKPRLETAAEAVARGQAAYNASHLDDALAAFETAIQREPQRAVPWYDAAATLYQLGRLPTPASTTSKPASTPTVSSVPRSIMPWGIQPYCWETYPPRSPPTTTVSIRPRPASAWTPSALMPGPIAGTHLSSHGPPRFLKTTAPVIRRNPSGRNVDETRIDAMTTAIPRTMT